MCSMGPWISGGADINIYESISSRKNKLFGSPGEMFASPLIQSPSSDIERRVWANFLGCLRLRTLYSERTKV